MPILFRILLQRIFIGLLAVLGFFGINPDVDIDLERTSGPLVLREGDQSITDMLAEYERPVIVATTSDEISAAPVQSIPLPTTNVLDELRARETQKERVNITTLEANRTKPPVFSPPPTKSKPTIPEQSTSLAIPEDDIEDVYATPFSPEDDEDQSVVINKEEYEIVISPPQDSPDASEAISITNSVVNIQCVQRDGNRITLSTGSGVLISGNGVILTNAHVAQYFLLGAIGYTCTIQKENIPLYGFTAKPLYISEDWIENNFMLLSNVVQTGTGEDDYALLYIDGSTLPSISLPSSFSHMTANTSHGAANVGDAVTAAGYPGSRTGLFEVDSSIPLVSDKARIRSVFTFRQSSIDVITTDDTPVAKQGSSGGGIFKNNQLVGIIATTNSEGNGTAYINAITLSYIDRDLRDATGRSLSDYIKGNHASLARGFQSSVAPRLTELLLQN
jgi:hypothetical protein